MNALLPPNSSLLERAMAEVMAPRLDGSTDLIRTLWSPDTCPVSLLPWLAWAMHVDNWDDAATEDQKRDSIRMSVHLHRKKGTPWAVKRALATLGLDIDVIDQQAQRAIYAEHNPPRLDGTWRLDGSVKIRPLDQITGVPQVQHWAQFIVRLNLADANNPAILARLRALIDEWKPQRSWPLFVYWLRIYFQITIGARWHFVLQKQVHAHIWSGLVITDCLEECWKLGRDGVAKRLDGSLRLDGSWQIGRLYSAITGPALRSARIQAHAAMTKVIPVDTRPRQRLLLDKAVLSVAPTKLGRWSRRLDGTWTIGTNIKLDGSWRLGDGTRLPCPTFTYGPRLDGTWRIRNHQRLVADTSRPGRLVLDGTWRLGGPAQPLSDIQITRNP